jgi:hypothetical protein
MLAPHLEEALAKVEMGFNEVSVALVSGEPVALTAASLALQKAALDFSVLLSGLSALEIKNNKLKPRLKRIANGLSVQRESLIRRLAIVDMALNTLVPGTQNDTYAKSSGPYGSVGKSSGAFKYLAA